MKKKLIILGSGIIGLFLLGFVAIYIWIDIDVRKNIKIAKEMYSGTAEDALLAYLADPANSPRERSSIAIWTLGQIHSEKAIPVLEGLYINDPKGETCHGKHDLVLCQYGIYKALNACKSNWWPLHRRLNR